MANTRRSLSHLRYGPLLAVMLAFVPVQVLADPPQRLDRVTCASGQVLKFKEAEWNCADDEAGISLNTTVVVSPFGDGTDYVANGLELLDAINSINPGLIRIEPGTYDVGETQISVSSGRAIEGSGQNLTFVTGSAQFGVFALNSDSEIRDLTIMAGTASDGNSYAILVGDTGWNIRGVTASALGGTSFTTGIIIAGAAASGNLENVIATAESPTGTVRGVEDQGGEVTANNLIANAVDSGSANAQGYAKLDGTLTARNSIFRGSTNGITTQVGFGNANLIASQIEGGVSGTLKCVAAYDENFDPLNGSCL